MLYIKPQILFAETIITKFPKEKMVIDDIYEKIVDFYIDAINYFLLNKSLLTDVVVDNLKKIILHLLDIEYKNSNDIISYMFEKISEKVGLAILYEKTDRSLFNLMGSFYPSIYSILERAKKIGSYELQETEYERIEPYSYLLEISESISDSLLEQCNIDFQDSVLLIKITNCIKQVFKLFIDLFEKTIGFDLAKSKKEIKKYLTFIACIIKTDEKYVKTYCDLFAYVGIKFVYINKNGRDIAIWCFDEIISIAKRNIIMSDCCFKRTSNILVYAWYIRIAADKNNLSELQNEIDRKIDNAIISLEQSQIGKLQEFFNKDKQNISDRLSEQEYRYLLYMDTAEDLLKQYINPSKNS